MSFWNWIHAAVALVAFVEFSRFLQALYGLWKVENPDWRHFHHAYIGVLLLAVPTLGGAWVTLSVLSWLLAVDLIHDDAGEHLTQLRTGDFTYQSEWHKLYARFLVFIARWSWGRWLIRQLKKLRLA